MSAEYTPTVVQSGPVNPPAPSSGSGGPKITLNFIHGSLAGTSRTYEATTVSFGRGADNALQFDPARDTKVSTRHGRISLDADGATWVLQDLGSTNGTFVDGARIDAPVALASGMTVVLGDAAEAGGVIFTIELNKSDDIFGAVPAATGSSVGTTHEQATPMPATPTTPQSTTPAAEQSGGGGFFSGLKGKFNRFMERQKLNGHLKTLQTQLGQVKQQQVSAFAALGRELVDADHIGHETIAALGPAQAVRALQGQIKASDERIAGIDQQIASDEASYQDWLTTFGTAFGQLETATQSAGVDVESARTALTDATNALQQMLAPRVEAMEQSSASMSQLAGALKSAPQDATNDAFPPVVNQLRELLSKIEMPIAELPDATARFTQAKQTLADAEAKLAELSKQLDAERAVKAQKQSEFDALVAGKRQLIAAEQQTIAGLKGQIDQQLPALGEMTASLQGYDNPAVASLPSGRAGIDAIRAVEAEIQKTQHRIEELSK